MSPTIVRELRRLLGTEAIRDAPSQLVSYSYDGTFQQQVPLAAVLPRNTDDVAAVLRLASDAGTPVVARGAATGLAGGAIPPPHAIVLNLSRMRRLVETSAADGIVVVESGVVTADLHAAVEAQGLFYPPDPASLQQCTIGGNLASNAGGPRCLKYGVTRDYVRGLTVVLADGTVVEAGGRTLKSSTGYALPQLFVGSEGTLGVITEATLRVIPLPRGRGIAVAFFPSVEAATAAVTEMFVAGVEPSSLELLDHDTLNLVEDHLGIGFRRDVDAALLIETDALEAGGARAALEVAAETTRRHAAVEVRVAESDSEAELLWRGRRAVSGALGRIARRKLGEDVVVPRSRIPEMARAITAIAKDVGLRIPLFGHAGDGNLHPNILFERETEDELRRVQAAAIAIFEKALELGGALSGEHGVGTLKREFLARNLGAPAVDTMRRIKQALDPAGILNPGKVFPSDHPDAWRDFLLDLPTLSSSSPV